MPKSAFLCLPLLLFVACTPNRQGSQGRTYRMGFAASAPRPDINLLVETLNLSAQYADAGIISTQVPWDSLISGEDPIAYVLYDCVPPANYWREKQFKLWVYIDPENGLDRTKDAPDLQALGLSIANPAVQQIYRRFVVVVDSILKPDHLGLALETNLIRAAAPDSIYQGVKAAANGAASDLQARQSASPLGVSVQAEVAWGKLTGSGVYQGIDQDFSDFPFVKEIGISSYPYFSWATPSDIPLNYYARLTQDHPLPVFVTEGGWTSTSFAGPAGPINSSPQIQGAYIDRQGQLLAQANALAVFQLTFTDLEISAWPPSDQAGLAPFAWIGLTDTTLTPKPALAAWDSLFMKPLAP